MRNKIRKTIIILILSAAGAFLLTGCTAKTDISISFYDNLDLVIGSETIETDYYKAEIPSGWLIDDYGDGCFRVFNKKNEEICFDLYKTEDALKRIGNWESASGGERRQQKITNGTLDGIEYTEITEYFYHGYQCCYLAESRTVYFFDGDRAYRFHWDDIDYTHRTLDTWKDDEETVRMITGIIKEGATKQ